MAQVKKFTLVPEELVIKHTVSNKRLSELDKLMIKILNSDLPDHEKLIRYHEVLQTSLNLQEFNQPFKEKQDPPEQVPVIEKKDVPEMKKEDPHHGFILAAVPKSRRSAAENILELIRKQPNVLTYNNQGEITLYGQKIEDSNIINFFKYIFDSRSVALDKHAYNKAITDLNIPTSLITNRKLHVIKKKAIILKKKDPMLKKSAKKNNTVTNFKWEDY